ncbi:MAG: energy transducer TonB [Hyphomicrobiales bacterium]
MRPKKSAKADLENKKSIFRQIGYIISLLIVFLMFETKSYSKKELNLINSQGNEVIEEIMPITKQTPPPPPKPKPIIKVPIFKEIEDTEEPEQEVDINVEIDQNEAIDIEVIQNDDIEVEAEEPLIFVEIMPEFKGGMEGLKKYLQRNLRYPRIAKETNITGKVYLSYVVEKDGSITDIQILRGIGGGCDEEAKRVVQNMPKWNPGRQNGRYVRVKYTLPISFILH